MEIVYILMLALVFAIGFAIGWQQREVYAQKKVEHFFEAMEEMTKEDIKENTINIKIEKHKEVFYIFNSDDDEFMGQGETRKDVESALAKRFPNKRFLATKENLQEVGWQ